MVTYSHGINPLHSKDAALAGEACRWSYGVRRGVFDVGHIAGLADASVEVKRPGVTSEFFEPFFGVMDKEKGHRVVPLLHSGSSYVPRCTPAERVILT